MSDDRVDRPQDQQRPLKQDEQQHKQREDRETGREPPRDPSVTDPEQDEPAVLDEDYSA